MGITLFKRPAARKEGTDSEFAATVATLPPGAEAAVPLPAVGQDGGGPDSLPPDSQPFDSQPFDSQPFDSRPFDSLPPDSQGLDSRPAELPAGAARPAPGPFDPHPPQELPAYLGGAAPAGNGAASGTAAPSATPVDESSLPMADQPTIAQVGRYALKRHLGLGGLGQVHEAWDPLLSRTVAIKTLQFESDPRTRNSLDRLFLNEARAVAGLSHPNIVTVYDAGLSQQGVYLAMERLQGKDLRQRLSEGWKPGPAVVAQLIRRVADALAYAHARGVVHCDIKPGNIFITGNDKPKVLDFGIARVAHRRAIPGLEGMVAGSPHYLAPEQLLNKEVDARTDVYSLGVVFYELLSGRRAFAGDSVEQITTAVLTNHPAPAHLIRSGVPETLSAIAARAMARDPEARYASASEMSAEIRNWFDQPRQPTPARETREARAEARRSKQAVRKREPSRWPWALTGAGVALLGVLAVGLVIALRTGPGSDAQRTAQAGNTATGAPAAGGGTAREGDLVLSGGVPVSAATPPAGATAAGAGAAASPTGGMAPSAQTAATTAAAPPGANSTANPANAAANTAAAPMAAAAGAGTGDANAAGPASGDTRTVTALRQPGPTQRVAGNITAASPAAAARDTTPRRGGASATPATAAGGAAAAGTLQFAISPWGQVEVNGQSVGTTPPLAQLSLPAGNHAITIRNADFPPFTTTVQVQADKPTVVRHRFGQ